MKLSSSSMHDNRLKLPSCENSFYNSTKIESNSTKQKLQSNELLKAINALILKFCTFQISVAILLKYPTSFTDKQIPLAYNIICLSKQSTLISLYLSGKLFLQIKSSQKSLENKKEQLFILQSFICKFVQTLSSYDTSVLNILVSLTTIVIFKHQLLVQVIENSQYSLSYFPSNYSPKLLSIKQNIVRQSKQSENRFRMQIKQTRNGLLTSKQKEFHFSHSHISEEDFNETSLQYCMGSISPFLNTSHKENPSFLQSICKKSDKPIRRIEQIIIMTQSVALETQQNKYEELTGDDKTYRKRIKEVQGNCEMCQSAIIAHSKKDSAVDAKKIKVLFTIVKQLKLENQCIKSEIQQTFICLAECVKNWSKQLQKRLSNRLSYQTSIKNSQIKSLQNRVQNLVEKVYSLQSQNQQIRVISEQKLSQIRTFYSELNLQFKINERQLRNLRQSKKQIQSRLIEKQSYLISCQAAKQNLEQVNSNLQKQIRMLRDKKIITQTQKNSQMSIRYDYQGVKDYIKQNYNQNKSVNINYPPLSGRICNISENKQPYIKEPCFSRLITTQIDSICNMSQKMNKSLQQLKLAKNNQKLKNKIYQYNNNLRGQVRLYQSQKNDPQRYGQARTQKKINNNMSARQNTNESLCHQVKQMNGTSFQDRNMTKGKTTKLFKPDQKETVYEDQSYNEINELQSKIQRLRTDLQEQIRSTRKGQ